MRPKRLALSLVIAVALAPGTLWRMPELPIEFDHRVTIAPLAVAPRRIGPFTLVAGWEMDGDRVEFGGFSALVALDDERFLAGSDTGRKLLFTRPDHEGFSGTLSEIGTDDPAAKLGRDLESLTVDSRSGRVWGGYEFRQSIVRFDPQMTPDTEVRPVAMREWGDNSGPEALVRLADGRFLVIEERAERRGGTAHEALRFAGDPVMDVAPEALLVRFPAAYRPSDATPLVDGRALLLLRRVDWGLPPVFETALAEIDIDRPARGGTIVARMLAEFGNAIPQDNYEGLALTRDPDGTHVWMISDDNFMGFQRTLLLKLLWDPREKARE